MPGKRKKVRRKAAAPARKKVRPARRASPRQRTAPRAHPSLYNGSCHCGALEYSYQTAIPPRRWAVRLCQCWFCRSHGSRTTSDPGGEVQFDFKQPEFLRRYRFGLRTADFLICRECGTYIAAVLLSGRGAHAAININTLRDAPSGVGPGRPVLRQGESIEERRARRVQTWTPVVGPV